ncbi:MAG: GxxExxY protein [Planctomycetaceae bacterium]
MGFEPIPERDDELSKQVIGAAIEVHRELGPGYLESIYKNALTYELSQRGLHVEKEKKILVPYKDIRISGQRLDLLVDGRVILELKCVDEFAPIHSAQILSYLKATGLRLGLLINFKSKLLKDGIKRIVR